MDKFYPIIQFIRNLYNEPKGLIPLHAPVFSGNEKKYLAECIDSTFVSSVGKFVEEFEIKMAEYTGAKKAVACVNGTSALHLALILAGVKQDDEVITQPLTFVATANAIRYCNANPVFVDVDMDTLGMSPNALREWLEENVIFKSSTLAQPKSQPVNKSTNRRIAAILPMHTFGNPCRITEIVEICNEYNIPLIEDAAESLGSFYNNQHTGTFGTIGVLSFNGNKIITTGGGGMLIFNDEALAAKAKHLTTQAKLPHPWEFVHDELAFNYRMPNINAALGLAQLEQLPAFLESKRIIAQSYESFFAGLTDQQITYINPNPKYSSNLTKSYKPNYWLNCLLFPSKMERDAFLKYSNEASIMTRPLWKMMNKLEMFRRFQTGHLSNAEYLEERVVNVPSGIKYKGNTD